MTHVLPTGGKPFSAGASKKNQSNVTVNVRD